MQDVAKASKVKKENEGKMFVKCALNATTQKSDKAVRIGVLGASGYTGSEVSCLTYNPLLDIFAGSFVISVCVCVCVCVFVWVYTYIHTYIHMYVFIVLIKATSS